MELAKEITENDDKVDELNRKILQHEIEKVALSKEKDELSKNRWFFEKGFNFSYSADFIVSSYIS